MSYDYDHEYAALGFHGATPLPLSDGDRKITDVLANTRPLAITAAYIWVTELADYHEETGAPGINILLEV